MKVRRLKRLRAVRFQGVWHIYNDAMFHRSFFKGSRRLRRLERRHHRQVRCKHAPLMARVAFDPKAARGLRAGEVRQRWPRLCARCPNCGDNVIAYASFQHYIAGDW
jgi:hypothetical protein